MTDAPLGMDCVVDLCGFAHPIVKDDLTVQRLDERCFDAVVRYFSRIDFRRARLWNLTQFCRSRLAGET